jgi:hypothetical protein
MTYAMAGLATSDKISCMIVLLRHVLGWLFGVFRSRADLILENLALRQQLLALHAHRPRRRLTAADKLFWVALRRLWSRWKEPLILVTPRTVVGWHRAGFRLYWKWLSRACQMGGRKPVESPNEILGGRAESRAYDVRLFSMTSRTLFDRLAWCCSQICNRQFLKDQQRSTIHKMQPAESTGDNMYTKKVTHLIPNQIP